MKLNSSILILIPFCLSSRAEVLPSIKKKWQQSIQTIQSTETEFKAIYKNSKLKPADLKNFKQIEMELKKIRLELEKGPINF